MNGEASFDSFLSVCFVVCHEWDQARRVFKILATMMTLMFEIVQKPLQDL